MSKTLLVLGGGAAGLAVVNAVARSGSEVAVHLVDSHGDHLYQPDLPRVAFRGDRFRPSAELASLVRPGVRLTVDRAAGLDPERRVVAFESGLRLSYDALVIATGSRMDHGSIPGAREASHNFHCRRSAHKLGQALGAFRGGRIVVASASASHRFPLAAAEFCLLLVDWLTRQGRRGSAEIECIFPLPVWSTHPSSSGPVRHLLEERGVEVRNGFVPVSVDPGKRLLEAGDGSSVPFDLLVLIPPHIPQPFLAGSGLLQDGWVRVDPLTLRAAPGVYALGDTALLQAPRLGSAARRQAGIVARNVISELEGSSTSDALYDGRGVCMMATGWRRAAMARFEENRVRLGRPGVLPHLAKAALGVFYFPLVRRR